jgi:hypothetical protein
MSKTDHYFTFPLAILHGAKSNIPVTPYSCIDLALDCAILGAGRGYRCNHGNEKFAERLNEVYEKLSMATKSRPASHTEKAEILVGAALCGVKLGDTSHAYLERIAEYAGYVTTGGPLVRMKGSYFWAAFYQARAEADPQEPRPEKGISWREFRILAAILSAKTNRVGFAFIGWETIQARSCGYKTKEEFRKAESIPDQLTPPLTHKQIRTTCEALEALGFFARFRFSSGGYGGLMAYSFRHDRESLGDAVCEFVNFRDRVGIRENRANDAAKCLKLLERAKSGQCHGKGRGKATGKGGGKHNEKSPGEKSRVEKSSLKNAGGAAWAPEPNPFSEFPDEETSPDVSTATRD